MSCLSDIQNLSVFIQKLIDAGSRGNAGKIHTQRVLICLLNMKNSIAVTSRPMNTPTTRSVLLSGELTPFCSGMVVGRSPNIMTMDSSLCSLMVHFPGSTDAGELYAG